MDFVSLTDGLGFLLLRSWIEGSVFVAGSQDLVCSRVGESLGLGRCESQVLIVSVC